MDARLHFDDLTEGIHLMYQFSGRCVRCSSQYLGMCIHAPHYVGVVHQDIMD